jgi:acetoin utilization deacetylase AcuC-like enzyme
MDECSGKERRMKVVYSEKHKQHRPHFFIVNRTNAENPDQPERIEMLLAATRQAGYDIVAPRDFGVSAREAVHGKAYLKFLETAWKRWQHVDPNALEIVANVHVNGRERGGYPLSVEGQAGLHMSDNACPISADTFEAACESANIAATAASIVLEGEKHAYALCRPPGHHASADSAAGFCYLNNVAIAAQILRQAHPRVAILDIDLHHGNGTQDIFYEDSDVFTASIHAHPERFYPFFTGYATETGRGAGAGANLNLPLAKGSGDDDFLAALETAIDAIRKFSPSAIVVAAGLDASAEDPFGGLNVSGEGYHKIGQMISDLGLPIVLVQEGGYGYPSLPSNLLSFLSGIEKNNARSRDVVR